MIKELRIKKGYTLEKLAEVCNMSWRNLQRIENGENKKVQFETMRKIIVVLMTDKEILDYIKNK